MNWLETEKLKSLEQLGECLCFADGGYLVGLLDWSPSSQEFICNSDETTLYGVTHYIELKPPVI